MGMEKFLSFQRMDGNVVRNQILGENGSPYPKVGVMAQGIDFYGIQLEFGPYQTGRLKISPVKEEYTHLLAAADSLLQAGEAEKARDFYQQALKIAVKMGNKKAESMLFNHIASSYRLAGAGELALGCYQQALDIAREIGDWGQEADCLMEMGYLLAPEEAIGCHLRALGIYEKLNDKAGTQASLVNTGTVFFDLGEYDKTISFCWKALQIQNPEKISEINSKIIAHFDIGRVWETKGKSALAHVFYQQSFKQCKKLHPYLKTDGQKRNQLMRIEFIISGKILFLTQRFTTPLN